MLHWFGSMNQEVRFLTQSYTLFCHRMVVDVFMNQKPIRGPLQQAKWDKEIGLLI